MTNTALSPLRMALAVPLVFPLWSTQVGIGPFGPLSVALAALTADGMSAMSGSPTDWPPQPQNVRGSGDSATNRVRLVVEPLPGNTTGAAGFGAPQLLPRTTSSVPADFHDVAVGFGGLAHRPNPVCVSEERRMPMAWNGPDIQRSMWLRADAFELLDTATLPLLPASSPAVV